MYPRKKPNRSGTISVVVVSKSHGKTKYVHNMGTVETDAEADALLLKAHDWIEQARQSGLKPIEIIADTLARHREGILAWYDYRISNGKLEGINNKIKTMKRQAYGYRDMPFFKLKLLSLHDSTYPFSG